MSEPSRSVKPSAQYFDSVDVDSYSRSVAADAEAHARAALLRRRPDLTPSRGSTIDIPDGERTQYELDKLAFVHAVADRLEADITGLVFVARQRGASWARIGLAIDESGQTSFNRYHKLEQPRTAGASKSTVRRRNTASR